jgi:mannose-6-phosphate isomerase-like protein (cupin superfamily)
VKKRTHKTPAPARATKAKTKKGAARKVAPRKPAKILIDKASAGADHVVGWTVLKPGARHERHRHHNCDEFFIVLKGHGHIYTDEGEEPSGEGDVVYSPRTCWHGFNNTSSEDVVLVWGWMGAGSIEASGYEVDPEGH